MTKHGRSLKRVLTLLSGLFALIPTGKAELYDPLEYLSDHLVSQGYDNFTAVGNHPPVEEGYVLKRVECLIEINRCRVIAESQSPEIASKSRYYWYKVNSQQLGWQTTRDIRKGEEISSSDLKWGMTDSFTCSNRLASKSDVDLNSISAKRLKAGTSLCTYDLLKRNDVRKGQWVTLTSQSESFELNIRVKVLESGNRGDVVQVRIPGSSSVLKARITAAGKVELIH